MSASPVCAPSAPTRSRAITTGPPSGTSIWTRSAPSRARRSNGRSTSLPRTHGRGSRHFHRVSARTGASQSTAAPGTRSRSTFSICRPRSQTSPPARLRAASWGTRTCRGCSRSSPTAASRHPRLPAGTPVPLRAGRALHRQRRQRRPAPGRRPSRGVSAPRFGCPDDHPGAGRVFGGVHPGQDGRLRSSPGPRRTPRARAIAFFEEGALSGSPNLNAQDGASPKVCSRPAAAAKHPRESAERTREG